MITWFYSAILYYSVRSDPEDSWSIQPKRRQEKLQYQVVYKRILLSFQIRNCCFEGLYSQNKTKGTPRRILSRTSLVGLPRPPNQLLYSA